MFMLARTENGRKKSNKCMYDISNIYCDTFCTLLFRLVKKRAATSTALALPKCPSPEIKHRRKTEQKTFLN